MQRKRRIAGKKRVLVVGKLQTNKQTKSQKMKLNPKNKLVPVLSQSTNSTGSHRSLWPVGTSTSEIDHDGTCDRVDVEMVTPEQAAEVLRRGKITFSSEHEFIEWLCL